MFESRSRLSAFTAQFLLNGYRISFKSDFAHEAKNARALPLPFGQLLQGSIQLPFRTFPFQFDDHVASKIRWSKRKVVRSFAIMQYVLALLESNCSDACTAIGLFLGHFLTVTDTLGSSSCKSNHSPFLRDH